MLRAVIAILGLIGCDGAEEEPVDAGSDAYVADMANIAGPGGRLSLVPDDVPVIGGLLVHAVEMSVVHARYAGVEVDGDDFAPALLTPVQVARIANTASLDEGFSPCFREPFTDPPAMGFECNGWRLPSVDEFAVLVADAYPGDLEIDADGCSAALDRLSCCYSCSCPDGATEIAVSDSMGPYRLRDLIGNVPEWAYDMLNGYVPVGAYWGDTADGVCLYHQGAAMGRPELIRTVGVGLRLVRQTMR